MDISIIIINYNTFTITSDCIRSVVQCTSGGSHEIVLVDNASTECEPENFLKEFPQLTLVKNDVNAGFANGNNLGIQRARGEYILLLNSDTILREDSIFKCLNYLKAYKGAGVAGCRMIFPGGAIQHTARKFRSINWELLDLIRFIPMMMPYKRRSHLMLGKYFKCDENVECDWVSGAFLMFEKKILDRLPQHKLDDRFFMYGEDQLWCEQIKNLGYKVIFYSGTTIVHLGSASTDVKKQIRLRRTMMKHELEVMRQRKGRGLYYWIFAIIYTLKETARNLLKQIFFKTTGRMDGLAVLFVIAGYSTF
jgi:GT2 family glycosyltransferase